MRVALIKNDLVDNVILADSGARAAQFFPDFECLELSDADLIGPGHRRVNGQFLPPEPVELPKEYKLTRLAFMNRFTDMEAIQIDMASRGDTIEAATVRRYMSKIEAATFIDLERADTRAGVLILEELGFLAAGRAMQILNTPAEPHEVYKGAV